MRAWSLFPEVKTEKVQSSCVLSGVLFVCAVDFLGLTNSIPTRSLFLPGCLSFLPVDLYV